MADEDALNLEFTVEGVNYLTEASDHIDRMNEASLRLVDGISELGRSNQTITHVIIETGDSFKKVTKLVEDYAGNVQRLVEVLTSYDAEGRIVGQVTKDSGDALANERRELEANVRSTEKAAAAKEKLAQAQIKAQAKETLANETREYEANIRATLADAAAKEKLAQAQIKAQAKETLANETREYEANIRATLADAAAKEKLASAEAKATLAMIAGATAVANERVKLDAEARVTATRNTQILELDRQIATIGTSKTMISPAEMATIASSVGNVNSKVKDLKKGVTDVNGASKNVGITWAGIGRIMTGSIISRGIREIALYMETSAGASKDLALHLGEIQTISQGAPKNFDQWTGISRGLSEKFGKDIKDETESIYQSLSDGVKSSDISQFEEQVGRLGTITVSSATDAEQALQIVMKAYRLNAGEAKTVADGLFETVTQGHVRLADIGHDLGPILNEANELKIPLKEIEAAFIVLSHQAGGPAQAGTELKAFITGLLKPSKELKQLLVDIGEQGSGSKALQDFGLAGVIEKLSEAAEKSHQPLEVISADFKNIRALLGASTLVSNMDAFTEAMASFGNATKDADGAAKIMADNLGTKLNVEMQKLKNYFIIDVWLPLLNGVIKLSETFGSLASILQKLETVFEALIAGGLTYATVRLVTLVGEIGFATKAFITLTAATEGAAVATTELASAEAILAATPIGAIALGAAATYFALMEAYDRYYPDLDKLRQLDLKNEEDAAKKAIEIAREKYAAIEAAAEEAYSKEQQIINQNLAGARAIVQARANAADQARASYDVLFKLERDLSDNKGKEQLDLQQQEELHNSIIADARLGNWKKVNQEVEKYLSLLKQDQKEYPNADNRFKTSDGKPAKLVPYDEAIKQPGFGQVQRWDQGQNEFDRRNGLGRLTTSTGTYVTEGENVVMANFKAMSDKETALAKELKDISAQQPKGDRFYHPEKDFKEIDDLSSGTAEHIKKLTAGIKETGEESQAAADKMLSLIGTVKGLAKSADFLAGINVNLTDSGADAKNALLAYDLFTKGIAKVNEELATIGDNPTSEKIDKITKRLGLLVETLKSAQTIPSIVTDPEQVKKLQQNLETAYGASQGALGQGNVRDRALKQQEALKAARARDLQDERAISEELLKAEQDAKTLSDSIKNVDAGIQNSSGSTVTFTEKIRAAHGATENLKGSHSELNNLIKAETKAEEAHTRQIEESHKAQQRLNNSTRRHRASDDGNFNIEDQGTVQAYFGGYFNSGGLASDQIPAFLSAGEVVMNRMAARQNLPALVAMNAGVKNFSGGGSVSNFGDINISVRGGDTSSQTIQQIGDGLRRAIRQGVVRLD